MTIEYNDPQLIKAISRIDPKLATIIECWDDLTWLQRKRIMLLVYKFRLNHAWQRFCAWFA